ncbi:MAG TPA: host attachment protein [Kofleriaceae bacterium]|nr:host attachment protein [Kofleriaceae bacterium]
MKRAVIAIVDAAQARLFTYEEEGADPAQQLHEIKDLANPGRKLRIAEQVSNSEPGRASASDGPALPMHGGVTHTRGYERSATDDHRFAKEAEMDAKFARVVVDALNEIINRDGFRSVILAAGPKMLGELRQQDGVLRRPDVEIHEIPKTLASLSVAQLHDHLAALDLVPPRRRLSAAR